MGAVLRRLLPLTLVAFLSLPLFAGDDGAPSAGKKEKAAPSTKAPEKAAEKPAAAQPAADKAARPQRPAPKSLEEALRRMAAIRVSVSFKEERLEDAVALITRAAGFNVIIAPALAPQLSGIAPLTMELRDATLKQVAEFVAQFTNTAMKFDDGIVLFTTPKDARGGPVLHIYDIAEMTMKLRNFPGPDLNLHSSKSDFEDEKESDVETPFSEPDKIVEMIQKTCGKDTWSDDGVSISADATKLIVKTYSDVQREIAKLLALLRAAR